MKRERPQLGICLVLCLNCAWLHATSKISGQIISADTNKPVPGLVLEADVNDAGVITSKASGYLKRTGDFEIALPHTSKPGSAIRLRLVSKGWLFVNYPDGRVIVPDDGDVGKVKVAPLGSITLLSAERLRYICKVIANGKRATPVSIGKTELQITPDSVISSMAAETGLSVKAFVDELTSWTKDPTRDASDRALAAYAQGSYDTTIQLTKSAIQEDEKRQKANATEEASHYSLMGNALMEEGNFAEAYDAFASALTKDSSFVEAHLKLGYLCLLPDVAESVHEDSSVYDLPDIASWNRHRDENLPLRKKCKEPYEYFWDAFDASRRGDGADDTKKAYVLFTTVEMGAKLGVGLDLDPFQDDEQEDKPDKNEKEVKLDKPDKPDKQDQEDKEDESEGRDLQERCRSLLKHLDASRSSDLPMTIYYAAAVLDVVYQEYFDSEDRELVLDAINKGIAAAQQGWATNAAYSSALLLSFRAGMEEMHVDLALSDWRRAVDSMAAYDKQEAAEEATVVATILHRLRTPGWSDNYSLNEQRQIESAEHSFLTFAERVHEQGGPKSAAEGHFKIGRAAYTSQRFREAAHHFIKCRSYALSALDVSFQDKCQQGVIGAFSSFDDSDADELDKKFVILCSEFKTLDPWVSKYVNPFPESSQDQYMFEDQIKEAKSLVHQEAERCANRASSPHPIPPSNRLHTGDTGARSK